MKYPWLRPLKAKALQQIAQKTGIQSSGTKAVLVERLEGELAPLIIPLHTQIDAENDGAPKKHTKKRSDINDGIRLLSIDMGIRNLAFAVLHAPLLSSHSSSTVSSETGTPKDKSKSKEGNNTITLTAWKRLSIPDLCHAQHHQHQHHDQEGTSSLILPTTPKSKSKETKTKAKEDFSPNLYARHAYTLITTLLATYNPTHILIERQRFRTGGGSAVQEWTIRVGVLEGMLYAVLETVNSSGLSSSSGGKVQVYPVESGRVSRFWGEGEEAGDFGDGCEDGEVGKKKKRKNVRDVKKMKIGLVRGWLSSLGCDSATAVGDGDGDGGRRVVIGDDEVRKLASSFLEKCEGKRRIKKADGEDGEDSMDIGKLDDLADCLVQGVTWLEWQRMREKIVRDGGINL